MTNGHAVLFVADNSGSTGPVLFVASVDGYIVAACEDVPDANRRGGDNG